MKELLEKLANGESAVEDVLKAIDEADKDKVPRSRLNDKIEEVKELEGQLKERDKQLKDIGKKAEGNEDLQKQINDLQETNKQTAADYQAKLDKQAFDFALEKAITGAQAKNPKAVKALLNTEAIKLDGDKLLGLEEQLTTLKESDSYLFGEEPGLKGRTPHTPPNNEPKGVTKEQFDKMSYSERIEIYNTDLELYQKLSK